MINADSTPVFDESLRLILVAVLGEENARRVLELVYELGEGGKELVMLVIEELVNAKEEIMDAQEKIDYLLRRLYGQNRERFTDPDQMELFGDQPPVVEEFQEDEEEEETKSRKKPRSLRSGRNRGLPTVVIEINPEGDLSDLQKIGFEVHRVFHYQPARIVVYEFVRNKYVDPTNKEAGVLMGELPDNVKGKRTATVETLSQVVINKYVDHLPVDRTRKQFSRLGADIATSTLNDFCAHVANDLKPLYDLHLQEVLNSGYIQADETRIPVRDSVKSKASGKNHLGYFWLYSAPTPKLVFVDYQPGRSRDGPLKILDGFQGNLQTDAYSVYDVFDTLDGIEHFNCVTHCRRKFENVKASQYEFVQTNVKRVLTLFRKIYAIEQKLRERGASFEERRIERQSQSAPLFDKLKEILESTATIGPESWKKAVYYALVRWEKLTRFLDHGEVEIDTNLVENRVRPIAIGRKNYLFAGSHEAAQRAAILYSLLNTCTLHGVNPQEWLVDVLKRIDTMAEEEMYTLLPQHWKAAQDAALPQAA